MLIHIPNTIGTSWSTFEYFITIPASLGSKARGPGFESMLVKIQNLKKQF